MQAAWVVVYKDVQPLGSQVGDLCMGEVLNG
jgi:hypothetical protein